MHFTWKTSKAKTIEDARATRYRSPAPASGSPSEGYPKLLNALAGTKFKIISGYPGSTQGMLAMERGEVDGGFTSWNTLKRTKQDWMPTSDINVLVQYGARAASGLARRADRAGGSRRRRKARQIMAFYISGAEVGRSLLAPPGIPGGSREDLACGVRRHA